jgi:hypothetical protein
MGKQCLIEASQDGRDWDSGYVGSESYSLGDAREYVTELKADPDWSGWVFRILQEDEDGDYRPENEV